MHTSEHSDPWIGRLLGGRYRLGALLGIGGMSKVYRAQVERTDPTAPAQAPTTVAIKILLGSLVRDPEAQEQFQREITICSHLRDHRIIHVLDHGVTPAAWGPPRAVPHEDFSPQGYPDPWPGSPYMVMEYVSGSTLQSELQRHPTLPVDRTLHLARHLVLGLRAAHVGVMIEGRLLRVVHRDLSPGNLYLVRDAYGKESIKLGDFGLARYVGEIDSAGLIHAGLLWGTLAYASPEQFRGGEAIDPRSDIYSLGCILYEMLTGHHPLHLPPQAGPPEWMHAHLTQSPRPFPDPLNIPLAVQQIVIRCLEKDAQDRFDSVMSLDAALQRAQQGRLSSPPTPLTISSPSARVSRSRWHWLPLACLPLLIWAGLRGYQSSPTQPNPVTEVTPAITDSPEVDLTDQDKRIRALLLRGLILLQKGDAVQAAVLFEEAVQLDPDHSKAQAGLGIALSRLDRLDQAEGPVQRALELTPEDSFVRTANGIYLMKQQNWEQAQLEFERAIQLNPQNYLAQAALEELVESQLNDDAAE